MKQVFSALLCLVLCLSVSPAAAFADDISIPEDENEYPQEAAEVIEWGSCGDKLRWAADTFCTITISGTGTMENYSPSDYGDFYVTDAPWAKYFESTRQVIVEAGVENIGEFAFFGFASIESVTIDEGVTDIGAWSFGECSNLESLELPESLISIGYRAFENCISLESVTVPDNVESIDEYAFSCCGNLTSVTIPNNAVSLGEGAFYNCGKLSGVMIRIA